MSAVAVAGSRRLPPGLAPRLLIRFLLGLEPDTTVNLRTGMASTGRFEKDTAKLADLLGLPVKWWPPNPTPEERGRVATFVRDMDMIAKSDLLLAFLTPRDLDLADVSGTWHLVEKAQDVACPVYCYEVSDEGVALVGATDPEDVWRERVPAA